MTGTASLGISIVAWNCRDEIVGCLDALQREIPESPVWVIDNASSDDTAAEVRRRFPHVTVVEAGANLGFGSGHNRLLRQMPTEFALILNPDTLLSRAAVLRCLEFARADGSVGIVSCAVRDEDGALQPGNFRSTPTLSTRVSEELFLNRLRRRGVIEPTATSPVEVEVVPGAFMMIRMAVGRAVDFFDDNLFLYAEDTDLCVRVREAGYRIWYLRDVSITHAGARSTVKAFRSTAYEFYRSEDYYFQKHYPAATVLAYRFAVIAGTSLRFLAWSGLALLHASEQAPARVHVYLRVLREYARSALAGGFFRRREVLASTRPKQTA